MEGVLGAEMANSVVHVCKETIVCMTTHVPAAIESLTARVRKALE